MDLNRQLIEAMADLNEDLVIATVRQMAAEGHSFEEIQQCLNTGISAVGTRFERGDYFIADLMITSTLWDDDSYVPMEPKYVLFKRD